MPIRHFFWILLLALSGRSAPVEQLPQLVDLIQTKPAEEVWMKIPWRVDLWAARTEAAAEGKPLLLWEMDGHPLGCT